MCGDEGKERSKDIGRTAMAYIETKPGRQTAVAVFDYDEQRAWRLQDGGNSFAP